MFAQEWLCGLAPSFLLWDEPILSIPPQVSINGLFKACKDLSHTTLYPTEVEVGLVELFDVNLFPWDHGRFSPHGYWWALVELRKLGN